MTSTSNLRSSSDGGTGSHGGRGDLRGNAGKDFLRPVAADPGLATKWPKGGHSFQVGPVGSAVLFFLVIEGFKDGDPSPVYRRFRESGRLAPPGSDVCRELGDY
jgi:hypothetical protein